MVLGTHLAFASVLYLGGATLFGYRPDWVSWALAAVASVLPDVDLPPARIGRLFWFVAVPLERRFGHRTITHSAVALLTVAALAAPLWFLRGHPAQKMLRAVKFRKLLRGRAWRSLGGGRDGIPRDFR